MPEPGDIFRLGRSDRMQTDNLTKEVKDELTKQIARGVIGAEAAYWATQDPTLRKVLDKNFDAILAIATNCYERASAKVPADVAAGLTLQFTKKIVDGFARIGSNARDETE